MKQYYIVNPSIKGSFENEFTAENNKEAGLDAYRELSQYFSSNVPQFNFTLKSGRKYIHYTAKEKVSDDGKVKFTVKEITKPVNEKKLNTFISETSNVSGGKFKYYDSSSSSSSSRVYNYHRKHREPRPISHWQYYPSIYPFDYYYVPQFIVPLAPYVYIKLGD